MKNNAFILIALIVSLTGCRTYGGYDSKELNVESLNDIAAEVATALSSAESELSLLTEAAGSDAQLAGFAKEYEHFVERHKMLVARFSDAELPSSYRGASRAIGATISEINVVSEGYSRVKTAVAEHAGIPVSRDNVASGLSYEVVPPYYRRIELGHALSMRDVLATN